MHRINKTLVYFLMFTIVTSAMAYHIVVKAYDSVLDSSYYSGK